MNAKVVIEIMPLAEKSSARICLVQAVFVIALEYFHDALGGRVFEGENTELLGLRQTSAADASVSKVLLLADFDFDHKHGVVLLEDITVFDKVAGDITVINCGVLLHVGLFAVTHIITREVVFLHLIVLRL